MPAEEVFHLSSVLRPFSPCHCAPVTVPLSCSGSWLLAEIISSFKRINVDCHDANATSLNLFLFLHFRACTPCSHLPSCPPSLRACTFSPRLYGPSCFASPAFFIPICSDLWFPCPPGPHREAVGSLVRAPTARNNNEDRREGQAF